MGLQQSTTPENSVCWVIGGGQFGRRAIDLLQKVDPAGRIIVVDKLALLNLPEGVVMVCADGIDWLVDNLTPDNTVDKIIPALPVHLAADWLKQKLAGEQRLVQSFAINDKDLHHFPHPLRINPSRIVISHADFICPPNCSEPEELCTYTGKKRPPALYDILASLTIGDFVPLIVQSRQFHAGVGGFFPNDLWQLLERARLLPDSPLLIGTACKCHGVVDGLRHSMG